MDEPSCTKSNKICALCTQNNSKYCCPRCGILYCSLDCYKSENHLDCSESFYRDCVNEQLAAQEFDDESKKKMIEILKRMQVEVDDCTDLSDIVLEDNQANEQSDIDSDDDQYVDLGERIKSVDLNDADAVWEALNEDERNEFEALLNKGDIESIVPQWKPWWLYRNKVKFVEEVDLNCREEQAALDKCPLVKEVPKLSTLTSVPPSEAIRFNITNVMASYAFIMRYFNGELEPTEGVAYVLSICDNLSNNTNFSDLQLAIESVAQNCMKVDLIETDENSISVMRQDTKSIIKGPSRENSSHYCKSALSHLYVLFFEAKNCRKQFNRCSERRNKNGFYKKFPECSSEYLPNLDLSQIKKCLKKIEYYLSYINSYGNI